ncbi:S8 family serine peptidase [Actinoplanes sp. NPDC051859]|uniref:S8 family serine peptidase n=1 Tax=Actinoplanes sp. NPDC051859 TaxID=3363909 RepID=UPI00379BE737
MADRRARWMLRAAVVALALGWAGASVGGTAQAADGPPQRPAVTADNGCAPGSPVIHRERTWAQGRLAPERIWPLSTGAGVTVAVLDTGISERAPALRDAVLPAVDSTKESVQDGDCIGSGTFLAGIIAARPAPDVAFTGLAPQAALLPVRVASDRDDIGANVLAAGIRAAVDGKAKVIAVGQSAAAGSDELRAAVVEATQAGVLIIAGVDSDRPAYPAAYPEVLAVAPLDRAAGAAGSAPAGRVDLVAPGEEVVSIATTGRGHFFDSGPAVAVAFVAGAAALVRGYHPELDPVQVKKRLLGTADAPGRRPLPDPAQGYGVVDPYAAVTAVVAEDLGNGPPPPVATARPARPAQPDLRPARLAYAAAGGTFVLVAAAALASWLLVQRRRRDADAQPGPSAGGASDEVREALSSAR